MPTVDLTIEQLLLDATNPRFTEAANQRDALQKVLDDQGEKLYTLAASIVEDGMSPIDRLLVLKEKPESDRFIALEGNRRVAALKLLAEPSLLTSLNVSTSLQKRLMKQAQEFDRARVEPLSAFEVADREEAMKWLYLRHTGENAGRGVVGWSGLATSRFRGTDPALQALDFVKVHGGLSESDLRQLDNSFPITTLDRLLASKEVRKRLGFDIKDRKIQSGLPPAELMKPLRKIVLDLASRGINVSRLKNKQQQIEYVEGLPADSKPNLSAVGAIRSIEGISEEDFTSKSKTKAQSNRSNKARRDPSDRRTVVPRTFKLDIEDNKTAQLFRELRDLRLDEFPLAISVQLRVFLEHSVDHYMDKHKLPIHFTEQKSGKSVEKTLKNKFVEVIDHMKAQVDANPKDFVGVTRALSDKNSPLSVDLLHAYVHNRFVIPKERDLKVAWDEAQRFFQLVWA